MRKGEKGAREKMGKREEGKGKKEVSGAENEEGQGIYEKSEVIKARTEIC